MQRHPMQNSGLLDGLAICAEHQCPMLRLGDDYRCAIEYTDALLGMHRVVGFVPGTKDSAARLVFDNGRSLPLICTCCGGPLLISDCEAFRKSVIGMVLAALGYVPSGPDGSEALELILAPEDLADNLPDEFVESPDGFQILPVHLDSVRQLRQPEPDRDHLSSGGR